VSKRILIIDDDDMIREIAAASLELLDWQVFTASSGAAGIEQASSLQPDAILLDVMMPKMDGPHTLAALLKQPDTRDIPVVFLTAKVQAKDRNSLGDLGARGVLEKPFDPLLLGRQVASLLGWSAESGQTITAGDRR
jgi:CheY-like chemotaxis protein